MVFEWTGIKFAHMFINVNEAISLFYNQQEGQPKMLRAGID
ncbi:hypothetical protein [Candidatus Formimonas warabiya]|nr:hypothetical protein [Candidatus Formimonas warabiya]